MDASFGWQFWIDRGGTFTDIVAKRPTARSLPTSCCPENPEQYSDAAVAGIRRLLGVEDGAPIPVERIEAVKTGTTVATNALLERKGERRRSPLRLDTRDALRIGYQARPTVPRRTSVAEPLHGRVVEIERTCQPQKASPSFRSTRRSLAPRLDAYAQKDIALVAIVLMHG